VTATALGLGATLLAAGAALAARGASPAPLPRFEPHGLDVGVALGIEQGPSNEEVAAEVRRQGFYAGAPVGSGDCLGCHRDVATQWESSAHRFSSFNNPYYRVATDAFRAEKGAVASRFCGNCHEPFLVATGAMDRPAIDRGTRAAQAGVTCLVCHSIAHVDREGNGRYDADLRAVPTAKGAHGARLRPALLSQALFCAACHKVGLGTDVTAGERWLRGQNDYDAWHVSAVSGNGAGSVYRPDATKLCQDCHMPLERAVLGDAGAHDGMVRSHRFLGANTALPHLRGDADQERRTLDNLRGRASLALLWSGPARVDALMRARGVGHRFPGGTMDSNEVWLEVTALDARGKVLGVSGGRGRDGALDPDTHLVRAQPVDARGAPLARRDPQHQRGLAFDAALTPSDPQVVRFAVPRGTARVRARLLYRKFTPAYAALACADLPEPATRARCLSLPIAEIAAADVAAGEPPSDDPATLVDWGLALADATADHADEARGPLLAARAKWPGRVEPLLGLARLASKLGQTDDVVRFAEAALALAPEHPAALALETRALLDAYRFAPARPLAERLARRLPGDRLALALLARARGLTGDAAGALAAADGVLAIDPESEEGFFQRSLALADLGRPDDARLAAARYETYRVSLETDLALRDGWRRLHPGHADESEPCHTHRLVARP
jgi:tetratricopeptide (TPR) repeat protein